MPNPLTELTIDQLRERRSEKWRVHPPDVLPLWVAEMDTPLAPPIRSALESAIARGDTGYESPGRLPEAYAAFSGQRYGWAPDPATIRLAPDVMFGVVATVRALTQPGDGVVINPPVYHPFFPYLRLADRRIVECPLSGQDLDLDRLEHCFASPGVTAYLLCNPQNPTGTVHPRAHLVEVASLAARYGVRVLVDEIHAPLVYPGQSHVPYLSLPGTDSAVTFVSASKAWNLPGLKSALVVAGPSAAGTLAALPEEALFGSGLLGVIAGEVAFRECVPWLDDLMAGLDANRRLLTDLLAESLPAVGYRMPDATYLAWLDCRALDLPGEPAEVFLDKGRVALVSGSRFGSPGAGHVRLNLATHPDHVTEAVARMARAVASCSP
jgi:cystathionine beta-lyase